MAFPRPTLTGLRQLARSYFAGRLPGADITLRRSVITVSADVMAALVNGVYGYLDWIIRQCFASTADWDYLQIQGAEYGLSPNGPTPSAGLATFTGTNGAIVPPGLLLQDAALNQYTTQASGTITAGSAIIAIEAVEGGVAGNLLIGAPLTLVVAIALVDSTATVSDDGSGNGLTGGSDEESIDSFRARVLARKRTPPQGGDSDDYVTWAKLVPGVTRAWPYPLNRGGGTVDLTFVLDGRANIVPLTGDVTAVQASINALRPVTDSCVVFAPTPTSVNFTIHGAWTDPVKAAITASLADMFASDAVPGGAYDPVTQTTLSGGLSFQDQIIPAVAAGAGDTVFNVSAPSADIAGVSGHLLVLGTISFVA